LYRAESDADVADVGRSSGAGGLRAQYVPAVRVAEGCRERAGRQARRSAADADVWHHAYDGRPRLSGAALSHGHVAVLSLVASRVSGRVPGPHRVVDGTSAHVQRSPVPASSEFSAAGCRDLMSAGAIDVCNFDSSWSGGPTEWRRVAAIAHSDGVAMAHHEEPQVASHLLAAIPHGTLVECFHPDRDPIWWNLGAPVHRVVKMTLSDHDVPAQGLVSAASLRDGSCASRGVEVPSRAGVADPRAAPQAAPAVAPTGVEPLNRRGSGRFSPLDAGFGSAGSRSRPPGGRVLEARASQRGEIHHRMARRPGTCPPTGPTFATGSWSSVRHRGSGGSSTSTTSSASA